MSTTGSIAKRNKRNPGHAWQDNELYDVFQPVIGAIAAHVFAQMTRFAYGHEVRMSLRELAEESGVSRSAAHRATVAMHALRMIVIKPGRGCASAGYDLLDLKEAAASHGAVYDPRRGSFVLLPTQIKALKKSLDVVLEGEERAKVKKAVCVPVRDTNACGKDEFVSLTGTLVACGRDTSVPESGVPLYNKTSRTQEELPPNPPSQAIGGDAQAVALRLLEKCGIAKRRWKRPIAEAIELHAQAAKSTPEKVAEGMVWGWREYVTAKREGTLRYDWSFLNFITQNHWVDPDSWPYDRELLTRRSHASVGMRQ